MVAVKLTIRFAGAHRWKEELINIFGDNIAMGEL